MKRYLLPPDDQQHVLGDVALDAHGSVFATDARTGGVYMVREGSDALEAVLEPGTLVSPQGLCFFGENQRLVVADYTIGLLVVDLEKKEARRASFFFSSTVCGADRRMWNFYSVVLSAVLSMVLVAAACFSAGVKSMGASN